MSFFATAGGVIGAGAGFVLSGFNPMGAVAGWTIGSGVGGAVSSAYQAGQASDRAKEAHGYLQEAAGITTRIGALNTSAVALQNKVIQAQFNVQRERRLQDRRNIIRQNAAATAAATFSGITSGMYRSSSMQALLEANKFTTQQNINAIDKSLEIGQGITDSQKQIATIQGQIAGLQGSKATAQANAQLANTPDPSTSWL